jgi:hypothetical protein
MVSIRDLSTLERTVHWLGELIEASRRGGPFYSANPQLTRDVTRKAKALRTSLYTLRDFLIPNEQEVSHERDR